MSEPTLQDVQRYLAAYLSGETSLSQFRDWFDAETWELSDRTDTLLGQVVGEIELRLAEFTNGHRAEDELRYELQKLAPAVDFQLPVTRAEPLVEMTSS